MKILIALSFLVFTQLAVGSSPISLSRFEVGKTEEGVQYETYKVKCDNGRIAWINKRGEHPKIKWCVGKSEEKECKTGIRKQVSVAKIVCK